MLICFSYRPGNMYRKAVTRMEVESAVPLSLVYKKKRTNVCKEKVLDTHRLFVYDNTGDGDHRQE